MPELTKWGLTTMFNTKNLRGQTLLFRCLETGFVTTAPALTRYQQGRGIDSSRRELVGERTANWIKALPTTTCEHSRMEIKGNQWAFRQHQQMSDSRMSSCQLDPAHYSILSV
jgi:hypothetical protein